MFKRTELKRCSYTHMMFPLDFFMTKRGRYVGHSYLATLWINMSQRAVNGRYAEARQRNIPGNCHHRRGISMAPAWVDDPTAFAWYILTELGYPDRDADGNRLTLDRIDNDGGYFPGNLRWATHCEQMANTSPESGTIYHG